MLPCKLCYFSSHVCGCCCRFFCISGSLLCLSRSFLKCLGILTLDTLLLKTLLYGFLFDLRVFLQILLISEVHLRLELLLFKSRYLIASLCLYAMLYISRMNDNGFTSLFCPVGSFNTGVILFILRYLVMHQSLRFHHRPAVCGSYGIITLRLLKYLIGLKLISYFPGLFIEMPHQPVLLTLWQLLSRLLGFGTSFFHFLFKHLKLMALCCLGSCLFHKVGLSMEISI